MLRVDDILDQVGQARYISNLDLAKGYWQVPVAVEDHPKTPFTTPRGLFQFHVMPFGLCWVPVMFQRMIDDVIRGMHEFTCAYLDDPIIFSVSWKDHLVHFYAVLDRLRSLALTVKSSKCQLAMREYAYLGDIVGSGEMKPKKSKLQAIAQFLLTATKKQVRSFLGLTCYYRCFIPNYASIAAPLTSLTKKSVPESESLGVDGYRSFSKLKDILLSSTMLRNLDFNKPFFLPTDASEMGVRTVLSQQDADGSDHPVVFFSRKLLPCEQRFSTVEKECLSIK